MHYIDEFHAAGDPADTDARRLNVERVLSLVMHSRDQATKQSSNVRAVMGSFAVDVSLTVIAGLWTRITVQAKIESLMESSNQRRVAIHVREDVLRRSAADRAAGDDAQLGVVPGIRGRHARGRAIKSASSVPSRLFRRLACAIQWVFEIPPKPCERRRVPVSVAVTCSAPDDLSFIGL